MLIEGSRICSHINGKMSDVRQHMQNNTDTLDTLYQRIRGLHP